MTVHPDYAKRYNQSRDLRRILIRAKTRPITGPDYDRAFAIADDLRASADLVRTGGYLFVKLHWPEDPDRGSETYGPFTDEEARIKWVNEVQAAADGGDPLLKGVHFLLDRMLPPFPVQR